MKKAAYLLISAMASTSCYSAIQLDFGNLTAGDGALNSGPDEFPSETSTIDYGVVGNDGTNDIYAQVIALNTFPTDRTSGSFDGDVRVRVDEATAQLRLSLFLDASYTTAYDPGTSFSWTATFHDIEGGNNAGQYESITLRTPGSYEIANDTELTISADGLNTTFSGEGSGVFQNIQEGQTALTAAQGQVAVAYTVTDTASIEFDYSAVGSPRNLFIDVGNLVFTTPTSTFNVGQVPEPSAYALITGTVALMFLLGSRRKRTTA